MAGKGKGKGKGKGNDKKKAASSYSSSASAISFSSTATSKSKSSKSSRSSASSSASSLSSSAKAKRDAEEANDLAIALQLQEEEQVAQDTMLMAALMMDEDDGVLAGAGGDDDDYDRLVVVDGRGPTPDYGEVPVEVIASGGVSGAIIGLVCVSLCFVPFIALAVLTGLEVLPPPPVDDDSGSGSAAAGSLPACDAEIRIWLLALGGALLLSLFILTLSVCVLRAWFKGLMASVTAGTEFDGKGKRKCFNILRIFAGFTTFAILLGSAFGVFLLIRDSAPCRQSNLPVATKFMWVVSMVLGITCLCCAAIPDAFTACLYATFLKPPSSPARRPTSFGA